LIWPLKDPRDDKAASTCSEKKQKGMAAYSMSQPNGILSNIRTPQLHPFSAFDKPERVNL